MSEGAKIRVRVTFTVEVDPEAWNKAYGCGTASQAVRESVRSYIVNGVSDPDLERETGLRVAG